MARIYRTYTLHLYDNAGEAFEPAGCKTLEQAQRLAQSGFDNEPSVTRAVITIDRFNGTFYAFESSEEYTR
jgi:hypothetical protein